VCGCRLAVVEGDSLGERKGRFLGRKGFADQALQTYVRHLIAGKRQLCDASVLAEAFSELDYAIVTYRQPSQVKLRQHATVRSLSAQESLEVGAPLDSELVQVLGVVVADSQRDKSAVGLERLEDSPKSTGSYFVT